MSRGARRVIRVTRAEWDAFLRGGEHVPERLRLLRPGVEVTFHPRSTRKAREADAKRGTLHRLHPCPAGWRNSVYEVTAARAGLVHLREVMGYEKRGPGRKLALDKWLRIAFVMKDEVEALGQGEALGRRMRERKAGGGARGLEAMTQAILAEMEAEEDAWREAHPIEAAERDMETERRRRAMWEEIREMPIEGEGSQASDWGSGAPSKRQAAHERDGDRRGRP